MTVSSGQQVGRGRGAEQEPASPAETPRPSPHPDIDRTLPSARLEVEGRVTERPLASGPSWPLAAVAFAIALTSAAMFAAGSRLAAGAVAAASMGLATLWIALALRSLLRRRAPALSPAEGAVRVVAPLDPPADASAPTTSRRLKKSLPRTAGIRRSDAPPPLLGHRDHRGGAEVEPLEPRDPP